LLIFFRQKGPPAEADGPSFQDLQFLPVSAAAMATATAGIAAAT
jgi:hypothetical protein